MRKVSLKLVLAALVAGLLLVGAAVLLWPSPCAELLDWDAEMSITRIDYFRVEDGVLHAEVSYTNCDLAQGAPEAARLREILSRYTLPPEPEKLVWQCF